jgi:hypothetical protein
MNRAELPAVSQSRSLAVSVSGEFPSVDPIGILAAGNLYPIFAYIMSPRRHFCTC